MRLSLRLVSTTYSAVSFVIVTFFALVSAFSRLRWFRFYFLALLLALGLTAVAVVSHRQFF